MVNFEAVYHPFWRASPPSGRFAGIGAENQHQLVERAGIIFAPAAHVAHPGWKIWHGDQFIIQVGEERQIPPVHLSGLAFCAGDAGIIKRILH